MWTFARREWDQKCTDAIDWRGAGLQKPSVYNMCLVEGMEDVFDPKFWNEWDVSVCVCMCVCMCVCACVCAHVHVCVCACVCVT